MKSGNEVITLIEGVIKIDNKPQERDNHQFQPDTSGTNNYFACRSCGGNHLFQKCCRNRMIREISEENENMLNNPDEELLIGNNEENI